MSKIGKLRRILGGSSPTSEPAPDEGPVAEVVLLRPDSQDGGPLSSRRQQRQVERSRSALCVRRVYRSYGFRVAVAGVSFDVAPGETLGLLGPNGAGKSTLLGLIAGVMAPDRGAIEVNGCHDPTRPDVRAQIGLAPQLLAVYPELSVEENVAFFGRLYGLRGSQLSLRVEEALQLVQLTERRSQRARCLSGGMQRRLNLAAAIVHRPKLLLLDEPTVGVDPQSRAQIVESLRHLTQQGTAIVYCTHYMEEVERFCERVALIDHGHLIALARTADLLRGKPNLESVFFELTGRQLRDTSSDGGEA